MVDHATVLLYHMSRNRMRRTTLKELSEETGIPRSSLAWLMCDSIERGPGSILRRVASEVGFDYVIFKGWQGNPGDDEPRLIIDVEKMSVFNRKEHTDLAPIQIDFEL